jgi:hypothetical protein
LFRRFHRTVEAIDKKQNFPAPKLRQRPTSAIQNASVGSTQSLTSPQSPTRENAHASSGVSTGTDTASRQNLPNQNSSNQDQNAKGKGKSIGSVDSASAAQGQELEPQRTKVVSPELRKLLSRKVDVLPRKIVRKEGEGLSKVNK